MTENQAKEFLESFTLDRIRYAAGKRVDEERFNYFTDVLKTAIVAIEEIQRYRSIGTVEECREAVERQRAKKPILCMNEVSGMFVDYADGHGEYKTQMNNWWRCPCCNEVVGQGVIVHKHIHDQRKKKYCDNCGQAIDWS